MLKIPSKVSISITLVISVLFFVACVVGMFFMPALTDVLIEAHNNSASVARISAGSGDVILGLIFAVFSVAVLTDILLFLLLIRGRGGKVFTTRSVSLIRGVAWCCFLLCILFCGLGRYFPIAFAVAFIAVFLGLCLRVVKNVIEEAPEIKSENDLTV